MPATTPHCRLSPAQIEEVAHLFEILAEPSRLLLLQFLQEGPQTVTALVEQSGMKQANVSKQLGVLHQSRLVAREREGNFVRYSIRDPMIYNLCALVCDKMQRDTRTLLERIT
ncbi:MAG: metalloregulator ArsR/SmtB family transcription factor [Kiritimatiellia bacterium]